MVAVAEDKRVVGDAKARMGACGKRRAADDDVYRAQRQSLVDIGFLAQAGGRKHLDIEFAIGAFFDFFGGLDRLGVKRFGRLIDVGPFQLLLGSGAQRQQGKQDGQHPNTWMEEKRMAHGDTFRRNDNCQQPYNSELPVGLSTNPRLSTVMGSD